MKTTLTAILSKNSFKSVANYLEKYKHSLIDGSNNAIKQLTIAMYEAVLANCYVNGIYYHTDAIHYKIEGNIGKVYTNDWAIMFNEMGTGVVGKNNPHPNPAKEFTSWKYDVNAHGERGWKYPKEDGTYGWTKGLPSRHMFYGAFNQIKDSVGDTVSIEIYKTTKDLYQ